MRPVSWVCGTQTTQHASAWTHQVQLGCPAPPQNTAAVSVTGYGEWMSFSWPVLSSKEKFPLSQSAQWHETHFFSNPQMTTLRGLRTIWRNNMHLTLQLLCKLLIYFLGTYTTFVAYHSIAENHCFLFIFLCFHLSTRGIFFGILKWISSLKECNKQRRFNNIQSEFFCLFQIYECVNSGTNEQTQVLLTVWILSPMRVLPSP